MFSKVWLINCVLAVILLISGINTWDLWHAEIETIPENRSVLKEDESGTKKKLPKHNLLSTSAYDTMVEKNLFMPDRASHLPDPEMAGSDSDDIRISGEKVILYGVLILDDYKKAMINNLDSTIKGQSHQWVKEGDRVGNLRVMQIKKDRIMLADGPRKYKVLLYDKKKEQKTKISTKSKVQSQPKPKIVSGGSKPSTTSKKKPVKSQEEIVNITPDGKYEVINTPLGKVKRLRK